MTCGSPNSGMVLEGSMTIGGRDTGIPYVLLFSLDQGSQPLTGDLSKSTVF